MRPQGERQPVDGTSTGRGVDTSATPTPPPHARSAGEVAADLGTDPDLGLTSSEARERADRHGPNELAPSKGVPRWRRFLAQFQDVLVVLLLAATLVSFVVWWLEGRHSVPVEALAIFGIVLFNAILGYVQEERAEQALAALRAMTVPTATVVRDGVQVRIPSREVVPGDLMLIEEGDAVAADARLLDVTSLQMLEAALTGESEPVAKSVDRVGVDTPIADRSDMVHTGTVATFGRGRAVVAATGMRTEIGHIASMLETAPERRTPLQIEIHRVSRILGLAVVMITVIVVASIFLTSRPRSTGDVVDVLLLGVSLAVAAVPEGLATVLTVVLALGVQRMASRNAVVKKLSAVETLGSATVIGSDKTGTLTQNEMTVRVVRTASGETQLSGSGYRPEGETVMRPDVGVGDDLREELRQVLAAAATATNARVDETAGRWAIQGDPTEAALLVAAHKADARPPPRQMRLGEVPFSSERKLMSVVYPGADGDIVTVFVKGAADVLLGSCTRELVGRRSRPLDEERRDRIASDVDRMAAGALRTIGVARRTIERRSFTQTTPELERDLEFLGVVGMIDPPRPESRDAVAMAKAAGVRVIMITGDHPATASAIAAELGIAPAHTIVATGHEMDGVDEEGLRELVRKTNAYARVSPEHKLRIVEALEKQGEVVAMTGDGVNDAPALKTADIGIAMGVAGTEVAKQAADVVLTDDNFATIITAIEDGRTIFSNIRKFIRYLLSSNAGEVLTMFLGVVFAGAIGLKTGDTFTAPLLATQILWINLLTDAAPALALGVDPAGPGVMSRPPRQPGTRLIDREMLLSIVVVGFAMAFATLLTLDNALPGGLIEGGGGIERARTMAFTVMVFAQLFNVFNARSDTSSAFAAMFANRLVLGAAALSVSLQVVVVYAPPLNEGFGTTPLRAADWAVCVVAASLVLWVDELWKILRRRRSGYRSRST
jgi:P-type Ca2+ transporter type 2C